MKQPLTLEQELEIIELYQSGKGSPEISRQYARCSASIINILQKHGISRRCNSDSKFKYSLKHDYFERIDTEDKAYFLGLMLTDGYNSNKGIQIGLQEKDGYLLEKFKECLEYTGPLQLRSKVRPTEQPVKVLQLTSKKLSQDLTNLGCIYKKTHFVYFPDIPEHLWNHLIRGAIDGDGSIYCGKDGNYRVTMTGNILFLQRIKEILESKLNICISLRIPSKHPKNIVTITCYSKHGIMKIRDYIYKDSTICLERKKIKFYEVSYKDVTKTF